MGWSLHTIEKQIREVFGTQVYRVVRPQASPPFVYFEYGKEISLRKKETLVALFPSPEIYVDFYPGTYFGEDQEEAFLPGTSVAYSSSLNLKATELKEHDTGQEGHKAEAPISPELTS